MKMNTLLRKYMPHWPIIGAALKRILLVRSDRFLLPEKEVLRAESDAPYKKRVVNECQRKWGAEYLRVEKEARQKIREFGIAQRQDELVEDAVFCHFAYGFSADEYFAFELANKTVQERKSYISDQYRTKMAIYLNDYFPMEIFLDKYKTYQKYPEAYKRDVIRVFSEKDWEDYSAFYEKHPSFIMKRVDLARGASVELVRFGAAAEGKRELFQRIIANGRYVLEEAIEQREPLAVFHPSSVNTVRLITIWKDNKLEIPYCILRTGRGDAVIDNASAGGISAAIDPKTGVITTDGMDERNHVYERHPDSGVAFKGYAIPDWDELLGFINGIATKYPGIVFVGWDVAYSKRGWCLVEGNHAPQLEARQVLCGGMKETFDRIIYR